MTPPARPPADPACLAFRRAVQAVFDGERDWPDAAHPAGCPGCRGHAAAARALHTGLGRMRLDRGPMPPAGFAGRVVTAARRDRRRRAFRRAGVGLAVAAGVLLAVSALVPRGRPVEPSPFSPVPDLARSAPAPAPMDPPPRVGDPFAEAGTALAALTQRTADETLAPTRGLLPAVGPPTLSPVVTLPPEAQPVVGSLAEVPGAAQAGFEPVTSSARRAVALFLRDTGLSSTVSTTN